VISCSVDEFMHHFKELGHGMIRKRQWQKSFVPEQHQYFVVLCSFDDNCAFTKLKKTKQTIITCTLLSTLL